jgi:predicted nucleic acid-binding protein
VASFSAVLDANVLYSAYLRDLLLEMADFGFFEVRWSNEILLELERALNRNFPGQASAHAEKSFEMKAAFPRALIEGHENLEVDLAQTDPEDRHVLSAAIWDKSGALVTFNLRDFPSDSFDLFGIEILSPDMFLMNLADLNPGLALSVVSARIASHRRPPHSALDYAAAILRAQCPEFAAFIAANEEEIESQLDDFCIERIALERMNDGTPVVRVKLEGL